MDFRVVTLDAEKEDTKGVEVSFAVTGTAETVDMSSGSLTAFVGSCKSDCTKSFRRVAGDVPVTAITAGGEVARDGMTAEGGGTEIAVTGG